MSNPFAKHGWGKWSHDKPGDNVTYNERKLVSAREKARDGVELKARLSLLEDEFLMDMAKVGDFGCKKYAEEDWRDNAAVTVKKRLDSLKRHVAKFASSSFSDLDDETQLNHLVHAAYNCMMIAWIAKHRPERDDRWKG